MSGDAVHRVFSHALLTVKRIPRTTTSRPPPDARLKLYGLYKQSTEGDVSRLLPRPVGDDPVNVAEREKWDAWHANASLPPTEAKRAYITTLIRTMHAHASTTPEARALVAELEFVWDQIKDDPPSTSSASSPYHPPDASALTLLKPASEPDDAEAGAEEDEDHNIAEARSLLDDGDGVGFAARSSDYDIRNRKWRKRIEAALVKMTAEVAALRELMEYEGGRRAERWGWVWGEWLVRRVLVDVVVVGVLWGLWRGVGASGEGGGLGGGPGLGRRVGDMGEVGRRMGEGVKGRVEEGFKLLMGLVRERGGRMEALRKRRLWGRG